MSLGFKPSVIISLSGLRCSAMPRHPTAIPANIADVQAALNDAKARLDTALLAGADTAPIRAHLAELERDRAKIAAAEAAKLAVAEQAERQAIAARAGEIAAEVNGRITVVLDGLQPPPVPF